MSVTDRRNGLRSQLHRAARDLGDIQSAGKGPAAYAKRRVRNVAYAKTNGSLRSIPRAIKL